MESELKTEASSIMPDPARPQFITVLCILTWVCCGCWFLLVLSGMVRQPNDEEMAEQVEKIRVQSEVAAQKMEEMYENQKSGSMYIYSIVNIVSIALCSLGALLMWQLKKKGFYLYLLGELIMYIALLKMVRDSVSIFAAMSGGSEDRLTALSLSFFAVFDVIFIAMYVVNLKHMKN